MAIKVTLGEVKPQQTKPFPKLMRGIYGHLVLFKKDGCGTLLESNDLADDGECGDYVENWNMTHFYDFNDPVTIQNP